MNDSIFLLENYLGESITLEYRQFLESLTFDPSIDYAVEAAGHYWLVDEFYFPNFKTNNLFEMYKAVAHAIPSGTFPLISTLGGLILAYFDSRGDNCAYYWDHERHAGDDRLMKIASSATDLMTKICLYDEDD